MTKLTDVQIRNWVRSGSPLARSDGGGLTFTLSAKGTAAWVLRYRFGGRPRELTLGRYPDIGLAKARELATAARAQVQQGKDVARDKQTDNAQRAAARTFRELAASYMAVAFPGMAESTIQHRRRHIEKDLLPRLGPLAARDVTAADIVAVIEAVGKRSVSVAELVFTAANEIFKHGIARHTVIANPVHWHLRFGDLRQAAAAPAPEADRGRADGDPAGPARHRPAERLGDQDPSGDLHPHQRAGGREVGARRPGPRRVGCPSPEGQEGSSLHHPALPGGRRLVQ